MPTQAWLDTVLDLLFDIEENTNKDKKPDENYGILDTIRDNFYHQLEHKKCWSRIEIKEIFEKSIAEVVGKENPSWQP